MKSAKIVHSTAHLVIGGTTWVGEWCGYIMGEKESLDRWLVLSKREADGSLVEFNDIQTEKPSESDIRAEFVKKRVKELQDEYGILNSTPDLKKVAEEIINRVFSYEWMGQRSVGYDFYVENLATILNVAFSDARDLVYLLVNQRKVGLNGFIITPWEEMEKNRLISEKSTGHKELNLSDFGGWSCSYCNNRADEHGASPASIPCVPSLSLFDKYIQELVEITKLKRESGNESYIPTKEERQKIMQALIEKEEKWKNLK